MSQQHTDWTKGTLKKKENLFFVNCFFFVILLNSVYFAVIAALQLHPGEPGLRTSTAGFEGKAHSGTAQLPAGAQ